MIFWVSRPTRSLVRLANVLTMLCLTASLSAAAESQPRWVTNEVEWFGEVTGMGHSPEMWACKRLRTKHFHGVLSGNSPPYVVKSRYGKVRLFFSSK